MKREDFARVMVYITAGCGKALAEPSLEVYFDLLGDLPYETLMVAAKRVLLNHRFASFPSIAELREAAVLTQQAQVVALAPAEAWALAWRAVGAIDPEVDGSFARATKDLPPLVTRAIQVFGVNALCYGGEPVAVVRAQFLKIYEQIAERSEQEALLPAKTRQAIESQRPQLPEPSRALSIAGWTPPAPEEPAS